MRQLGTTPVKIDATMGATANVDLIPPTGAIGFRLFLITDDVSGTTPTVDIKVRHKRGASTYIDIPGASFAQVTTVATAKGLIVYPGIGETNNESVSDAISGTINVLFTLGGTLPVYNMNCTIEWLG